MEGSQSSFYSLLFRQKYIRRWSLMRNNIPESLSEHTAEVAVLAHALALIGNRVYGAHYDPSLAAALALFHDAPEVYTSDLPTPIKYFSPEMKAGYAAIEEKAAEKLLSRLPEELREDYRPLLSPDPDLPERRLVKAADTLCAYIKCLTEKASGNPEFGHAERSTRRKLEESGCPELHYFMEHFIDTFTLTVDEL